MARTDLPSLVHEHCGGKLHYSCIDIYMLYVTKGFSPEIYKGRVAMDMLYIEVCPYHQCSPKHEPYPRVNACAYVHMDLLAEKGRVAHSTEKVCGKNCLSNCVFISGH